MRYLQLLALPLLALLLCTACNNDAPQKSDKDHNPFVVGYKLIYRDYHRVPLDTTRARLNDFLSKYPNDAKSWVFLGRVCYDMNDTTEAENCYRKAIEHNKQFFEAYSSLGSLYNLQGKTDSAMKYFKLSLANNDSSSYTRINLAWLYKQAGDDAKCAEMLKEIESRNDSLPTVLLRLAHLQWLLKNSEAANATVAKAVMHGFSDTAGWNAVLNGNETFENFCRKNHL